MGLLEQAELWQHGSGLSIAIRESRRARNFILQIVPPETVEVVVPKGTRPKEIQQFVEENRTWLAKAREELTARFGSDINVLPHQIPLVAIGKTIDVHYAPDGGLTPHASVRREDSLIVAATMREPDRALASLRKWLLRQGHLHLVPWLGREARRLGLAPKKVQIRLQRTRWGSCSGSGTVSLNACLLLVRPELVRYLLVHELCHLQHLNHSPRYWRAVVSYEPDYLSLDAQLAEEWGRLPYWIFSAARATG